jgi:hypothetical protein
MSKYHDELLEELELVVLLSMQTCRTTIAVVFGVVVDVRVVFTVVVVVGYI